MSGSPENDREILERFLSCYWQDCDHGELRTLGEYLRMFPGADDLLAREFLAIRDTTTSPVDLPASPGASPPRATGLPLMIGRYRILAEIGRGGQGVVYLAEDMRLRRRAALKVLGGLRTDTRGLERFTREAAVVARLEHPGICPIYETGTDGECSFIAMRYVEGRTLAREIAGTAGVPSTIAAGPRATWPALDAASEADGITDPADGVPRTRAAINRILLIVEKVARTLHAAHEAGIIHRDVKPANIIVTPEDEPILLDFGLALTRDHDQTALTRMGDVPGTPAYLSPEQVRGTGPLDRRTDVYSLGVTLYELLTHRRPFEAPTHEALFQAILANEPRGVGTLNPAVERDLGVVLATAMEHDLPRRYQTAAEFAEELRRVRDFEPIHARPAGPALRLRRWTQRHPAVAWSVGAAFLGLSAGLVTALFALNEAESARDAARADRATAVGDRNAKAAMLGDYERLADVKRLQSLLADGDRLYPAGPENVAPLERWLERADRLAAAKPLHEAALATLRLRATDRDAPTPAWRFADDTDQFKHDVLAGLVADLTAFLDPDPAIGAVARMRRRLAFARDVERRTITGIRDSWQRAITSIADRSQCPRYDGLTIEPQIGLIPLGRNPVSGLWEFAHLETGDPPVRDAAGHLACGDGTGIVLVLIPGGTFAMGAVRHPEAAEPDAPVDALARVNEQPVRRITLAPFFLAKQEMTQGQWLRATGRNPSIYAAGSIRGGQLIRLTNPVEQLSWALATKTLAELDLLLPTEAQWEYAARAATRTPWSCGGAAPSLQRAANIADAYGRAHGGPDYLTYEAWDDGFSPHAPVGSFEPNAFGLHDTLGNILEWCADWYGEYNRPARPGDGLSDGPAHTIRVVRGGSFLSNASICRCAWRDGYEPDFRAHYLGVRAARALRGMARPGG